MSSKTLLSTTEPSTDSKPASSHYRSKLVRTTSRVRNQGAHTLIVHDLDGEVHVLLPGNFVDLSVREGYGLRVVRLGESK